MVSEIRTTSSYYKYLGSDRITYLDDPLLRFTQPGDLNDPFECYPKKIDNAEINEEVLRQLKLRDQSPQSVVDQKKIEDLVEELSKNYIENTFQQLNLEIGILSLSKCWKSSLMWSHYCHSHTGFCIGFKKGHKFLDDFTYNHLKQSQLTKCVEYKEERAKLEVGVDAEKKHMEILIRKSLEWEYEKEVRIIKTLNLSKKKCENEKGSHEVHLFEFPHDLISEIIIGVRTKEDIKEKILEFRKGKDIKIYQTMISETTFDMERKEITL